jgi:hypothetical protein
VIRYIARANAFFNLQTDEWPPFGFEEAPGYPIRAPIAARLERYNRWKAVAWFHIVLTGRNATGTHNVLSWGLA